MKPQPLTVLPGPDEHISAWAGGLSALYESPRAHNVDHGGYQSSPQAIARRIKRKIINLCAHDGCDVRLYSGGTSGLCKDHLHEPGLCQCTWCRERDG